MPSLIDGHIGSPIFLSVLANLLHADRDLRLRPALPRKIIQNRIDAPRRAGRPLETRVLAMTALRHAVLAAERVHEVAALYSDGPRMGDTLTA